MIDKRFKAMSRIPCQIWWRTNFYQRKKVNSCTFCWNHDMFYGKLRNNCLLCIPKWIFAVLFENFLYRFPFRDGSHLNNNKWQSFVVVMNHLINKRNEKLRPCTQNASIPNITVLTLTMFSQKSLMSWECFRMDSALRNTKSVCGNVFWLECIESIFPCGHSAIWFLTETFFP